MFVCGGCMPDILKNEKYMVHTDGKTCQICGRADAVCFEIPIGKEVHIDSLHFENPPKNKMIAVPIDTFKVFLRPKSPFSQSHRKTLIEAIEMQSEKNILFIPADVDVIIVEKNGRSKKL